MHSLLQTSHPIPFIENYLPLPVPIPLSPFNRSPMFVTPFTAEGQPPAHQPPQCRALNYVDYTNFAISLVLLVGILLSYFPQHYRIIARGTSFGLSPYFVLLGTTSATSAFANIIVLPPSRVAIECCRVISPFACTAGLLGVAQITVQWICFSIMCVCEEGRGQR